MLQDIQIRRSYQPTTGLGLEVQRIGSLSLPTVILLLVSPCRSALSAGIKGTPFGKDNHSRSTVQDRQHNVSRPQWQGRHLLQMCNSKKGKRHPHHHLPWRIFFGCSSHPRRCRKQVQCPNSTVNTSNKGKATAPPYHREESRRLSTIPRILRGIFHRQGSHNRTAFSSSYNSSSAIIHNTTLG